MIFPTDSSIDRSVSSSSAATDYASNDASLRRSNGGLAIQMQPGMGPHLSPSVPTPAYLSRPHPIVFPNVSHAAQSLPPAVSNAGSHLGSAQAQAQTFACIRIGNQTMTLTAATDVFLSSLEAWKQYGYENRLCLDSIAHVAEAILHGVAHLIPLESHSAAVRAMTQQMPEPSHRDAIYISLQLLSNHVREFDPATSSCANSRTSRLLPAAFFVSKYARLLLSLGARAGSEHALAQTRVDDLAAITGRDQPPSYEVATQNQPPLRELSNASVVAATHFGPDKFAAHHAALDPGDIYTNIEITQLTALGTPPDYSAMLVRVKNVIAGMPVNTQTSLAKYRLQREQLIQAAFAKIGNRIDGAPVAAIHTAIGNEAAEKLAREVRRLVAPMLPARLRNKGHRSTIPQGWKDGLARAHYDSRALISDAVRLEICTQALNMPLTKRAYKDVLKATANWLNQIDAYRAQDRGLEEYPQALFSLAATLRNPPANFGNKNLGRLSAILWKQHENLAAAADNGHLRLDQRQRASEQAGQVHDAVVDALNQRNALPH